MPVIPTVPSASIASVDGAKATYSAGITGLVSAASATDLFTVTGSATKTVRITRLEISGEATTAAPVQIVLLKRSTANTLGTSSAPTLAPHDSANVAATATVLAYTANPTTGTLVANLKTEYVYLSAPGTSTGGPEKIFFNFGDRPEQCPVLRGINEVYAVNLNGVTITGGAFDINVTLTEE